MSSGLALVSHTSRGYHLGCFVVDGKISAVEIFFSVVLGLI